jgi:hypothetical protein
MSARAMRCGATILAFLWWTTIAAAASPDGRTIVDEVSRRHDPDVEMQIQAMDLVDADGAETHRSLRRYVRKGGDGLRRHLLVFDEPAGVRGVALLTWEKPGDDDQWVFLPAMGNQLKRIAGGGRQSNFMGTDFAFEDLVTEDHDAFRYDRLPDEVLDGQPVFVIDAFPGNGEESTGYERRRMYIRVDNYMVAKVDYFAKAGGRHIKTFKVDEMARAEGQRWIAVRSTMETLKGGHKTRLHVTSRSNSPADTTEDMFTHLFIQSRRHLR